MATNLLTLRDKCSQCSGSGFRPARYFKEATLTRTYFFFGHTVPLIRVLVTDMSEIDRVQERIAALEIEIGGVKAEIGGVKAQIAALEIEIARVKGDKDWMLLGEIERARIDRLEENKIVSLREEKIVLQKKEIVLREEKNILQARLPAISRGTLYITIILYYAITPKARGFLSYLRSLNRCGTCCCNHATNRYCIAYTIIL